MNSFTPGIHGVGKGLQLPIQEKLGLKNGLYAAEEPVFPGDSKQKEQVLFI